MTEWPLVLFTVALQLSCGLALSSTVYDLTTRRSGGDAMRPLALAVFPLAALGLLASSFHLGRPFLAVRALSNLGSSRLSIEILLSLVFALMALVYGYLWWKRSAARSVAGVITSLAGLAAVASSFQIYMVPTQPAWNSGWLPVSFLGAVLLFAGVVPASLLELDNRKALRTQLTLGVAGGVALLVSVVWMITAFSRPVADDFAAARLQAALPLVTAGNSVWLSLYLLLATVLPVGYAVRRWSRVDPETAEAFPLKTVVFFSMLAGVIIGRVLMYAAVTIPL